MIYFQALIVALLAVGTWGALRPGEKEVINKNIAKLLTILDDLPPPIKMDGDTRPYAAGLITVKWLKYLQPGREFFGQNIDEANGGYNYDTLAEQLQKSLRKLLFSYNPKWVDAYSNTVITFSNQIDRINVGEDGKAYVQALQEMLLQGFIEGKQLNVREGDSLTVKGDLFLRLKNPQLEGPEIDQKLTRTFKVPPLDTLTILK